MLIYFVPVPAHCPRIYDLRLFCTRRGDWTQYRKFSNARRE